MRLWWDGVTVWKLHRFDFIGSGSLPLYFVLVKVACDFQFSNAIAFQELHDFLGVMVGKGLVVHREVLMD